MLHFFHGVMGSSKTAMLLMQRHNCLELGLKVALVKPAIDTRISVETVYSRVGLQAEAEIVLEKGHSVKEQLNWLAVQQAHSDFQYIFVDEAQFLTEEQVQELADLADDRQIFCYGLKTDITAHKHFSQVCITEEQVFRHNSANIGFIQGKTKKKQRNLPYFIIYCAHAGAIPKSFYTFAVGWESPDCNKEKT